MVVANSVTLTEKSIDNVCFIPLKYARRLTYGFAISDIWRALRDITDQVTQSVCISLMHHPLTHLITSHVIVTPYLSFSWVSQSRPDIVLRINPHCPPSQPSHVPRLAATARTHTGMQAAVCIGIHQTADLQTEGKS